MKNFKDDDILKSQFSGEIYLLMAKARLVCNFNVEKRINVSSYLVYNRYMNSGRPYFSLKYDINQINCNFYTYSEIEILEYTFKKYNNGMLLNFANKKEIQKKVKDFIKNKALNERFEIYECDFLTENEIYLCNKIVRILYKNNKSFNELKKSGGRQRTAV